MTDSASQVVFALRWYLVIQAFGLAVLPLCLRLFRHLPDRGYGVSKPLGLLLAGWLFWMLVTLGWLRNTAGGVLFSLCAVAAASLLLYLTTQQPSKPTDQLTNYPTHQQTKLPWRTVLLAEAVFAVAFAAWCIVRAHMPRIETAGGEKWMEIAFLRAILRSDTFPPHDPWLSGFAISYYYFGYVIMAMITRLAGVLPSIAFNLGIAALFALTCTGGFSLVYNLVAAGSSTDGTEGTDGAGRWATVLSGLLGPLLLVLMGNLEGMMEALHARGIGSEAFWRWVDIRALAEAPPPPLAEGSWVPSRFFWWWQASRVVRDYSPTGNHVEVIDEFPAFSFLLGDMHPHVLALPFVLLAIALALNLYLRALHRRPQGSFDLNFRPLLSNWPFAGWEFFVTAVCLGGLGFLNTWDFPIYLFVVTVAYALAHLRDLQGGGQFTFYALRFALLFVSLLVLGLLLYYPFWRSFQSQVGGIVPNLINGTRLTQFLLMFGPLLFIAVAFVVARARRAGVRAGQVAKWTLFASLGIVGLMVIVVGLAVLLIRAGVINPLGAAAYLDAWARGQPLPELGGEVPSLLTFARLRLLIDPEFFEPAPGTPAWSVVGRAVVASPVWVVLGLVAFLVTVALTWRRAGRAGRPWTGVSSFVLLLLGTGALLTLGVEFAYIKDHFGTRMNTVFKFYFQAWILWSIGGAYALATFIRRGGAGRAAVVAFAGVLICAGLVYPALAIPERAGEQGDEVTLDGAAYLARDRAADYAGISWLNEYVEGAPVILETPGGGYVYEGRVSAHTGLPTVLGWWGHEHQWRGSYDETARRQNDIETLYSTTDVEEALTLLDRYDIRYVYVGPVERSRYPAEGLAKFAGLMDVVYEADGVVIYRR
jgi:YYY domain-containing protein